MLAYNQPLSILHGSLISTQPASDDEKLICVRQAIVEIVRLCGDQDRLDTIKREIHLFLLINTDFTWAGQDLMENEAFSSLASLVPALPGHLFMVVVSNHDLWPYLVETIPFLPPPAAATVVDLCLGLKIFSPPTAFSSALLTGLVISCATWARRWTDRQQGREMLAKVLHKFAQETLKKENTCDELQSILLLNVLMMIKHLIVPVEVKNKNLEEMYAFQLVQTPEVDPVFSSEIESLLVIFKALVCNFSFDSWISLTCVSTGPVLQQSQLVPYWPVGQFAPSNMQLLLAHMQAECRLLLQDSCKLQELAHVTQVLQIMSGFASFYNRNKELNMEEMEPEELFQNLTISEGWKKQAYVDHLMEQTELDDVLRNEGHVDILLSNHQNLNPHTDKLFNCLVPSDHRLTPKLKELLSKVLNNLPDNEVAKTFVSFHAQFGLTTKLKSEDFTQRFVSIMNRASVGSEDTTINREFLILAIEDGEAVVRGLFDEAANNKGKVDTCAGLLMLLISVSKLETGGGQLFSSIVIDFILDISNDAKSKENVFNLSVLILKSEPCFSPEIVHQLMKSAAANYEQEMLESAANLAEMVLGVLKEKTVMGCVGNTLKLKVGVVFISVLNNMVDAPEPEMKTFRMKEVSLEIVRLLFKSSNSLKTKLLQIMKKEIHSYFVPVSGSPSLLDQIHSNYWQGESKLSSPSCLLPPDQLTSQLLVCLPQLLKSEWQGLPDLVQSICPVVNALPTIIACLVLAVEKTESDLAYHMVLALCSLAVDTQESAAQWVRQLAFLLDTPGLTRDTVRLSDVVWPCLHNTLGKYLARDRTEDKEDGLVKDVLAMVVMRKSCCNTDIVLRMIQQSVL